MLLEFLAHGADECPLLRFYQWADGEISLLRNVAETLANGTTRSVEVHRLPFINAQGGITFTCISNPWNRGVPLPHDSRDFAMQLPPESWGEVADIIRPFERSTVGYNWLLPITNVQVLLSWSGQW
jgi:hypothetical protein